MYGTFRIISPGPDQDRWFSLQEEEVLKIGRARDNNAQLNDPKVSKSHCQIRIRNGRALLADLGSSHGTWVNGERVVSEYATQSGEFAQVGDGHPLQSGDIIRVGDTEIVFAWTASDERNTSRALPAVPSEVVRPPDGRQRAVLRPWNDLSED